MKGLFAMTIGERIKDFRKKCNMTQNELADQMGVSVQAVSKWETDKSAPDISLLVPLSTVLGVSTDTLLGKLDCGMDELNRRIGEINEHKDGTEWDTAIKRYKTALAFSKQYPYDMDIAAACMQLAYTLIEECKKGAKNASEDGIEGFFSTVEKSVGRIVNSDAPLMVKSNAQMYLISACALMGYDEKAKAETDKFTPMGYQRFRVENEIADKKTATTEDLKNRVWCQRRLTTLEANGVLWELEQIVRKMASLGDAFAGETIKTGRKIIRIYESFESVLSKDNCLFKKLCVLRTIGTKYAALGDIENALRIEEEIADCSEELFDHIKGGIKSALLDTVEFMKSTEFYDMSDEELRDRLYGFTTFWEIYDDKENNPIVASPRYKAVVERIKGSKR